MTDYVIEEAGDGERECYRLRDANTRRVVLDGASLDELYDRMEELKAASDRPLKFTHEGEMQDLGELVLATRRRMQSASELNAAVQALMDLELSLLNCGDEQGANVVIDARLELKRLFIMEDTESVLRHR
jgi:hypothetical protein